MKRSHIVLLSAFVLVLLGFGFVAQQQVQWGTKAPAGGEMFGGVDPSGNAHAIRTDSNGNLLVTSPDADGGTPTMAGLLASGIDAGGVKRIIKTDASGNMLASVTSTPAAVDPCQDPLQAKNSAAINVSGAGTAQLVAPSGVLVVYPCQIIMSLTGTAPTYQWIYGTGSTCGTGTVTLSGAITALVSSNILDSAAGSIFKPSAVGAGFCLTLGGTLPNAQGKMLFVQK